MGKLGAAEGPLINRLMRAADLKHSVYVQIAGIALTAPAVLLLSLVVVVPFVTAVWWSFAPEPDSGLTLAGYRWIFDPSFFEAFKNSLYIGVGSVALELLVAIPAAILLNQAIPGRGFCRAALMLPWAVPTIAVAAAFLWLANTNYGLFNQLGLALGVLQAPIAFLGSPTLALSSVTVAHAWKGLPLVFVIILSALQSLPPELMEAAKVDGAGMRSQFTHVVLPHLTPSIALSGVLSGIYNFALFDITFLLTGGGPAGVTTTLPLLLYYQEFKALDTGRAAVVGISIFLAGLMALIALRWSPFDRKGAKA